MDEIDFVESGAQHQTPHGGSAKDGLGDSSASTTPMAQGDESACDLEDDQGSLSSSSDAKQTFCPLEVSTELALSRELKASMDHIRCGSVAFMDVTENSVSSLDVIRESACSMAIPKMSAISVDAVKKSSSSMDVTRDSPCFMDIPDEVVCPMDIAWDYDFPIVKRRHPSCHNALDMGRYPANLAESPRYSTSSADSPRYSTCSMDSPRHSTCSAESPRSPRNVFSDSPRHSLCSESPRHSACFSPCRSASFSDSPNVGDADVANRTYPAPIAVQFWLCRDAILNDLRAEDIMDHLIQDEVLTTEDMERIMRGETTRTRAELLLEHILLQDDRQGCDSLLCALCLVYPHLAEVVQRVEYVDEEQSFMFQKWLYEQSFHVATNALGSQPHTMLQMLSSELRYQYSHRLQYVTPVPWNDAFRVPIDAVFSPLRITHASHSQWGQRCLANPRLGQQGSIRLNDLFATLRQHCMKHRCFLLEGEPGTGKTTACRKLVYDWATEVPDTLTGRRDHDCYLVFFLEAQSLHTDDIIDCIYASILPDSFPVTKAAMAEVLAQPAIQEKVLIIVDAYDEQSMAASKGTVLKLLQGKILSRATVLITSRSTFANNILRYIDVGLVVHGFACLEDKLQFVLKYDKVSRLPDKLLKELHLYLIQNEATNDLSSIPLYLWFICLLAEDNEGCIPKTRTALHESIVELILRKAVDNRLVEEQDIADTYSSLAGLAFHGMCKNRDTFTAASTRLAEETLEILVAIGLLVCNYTPLKINPEKTYCFPHKTLKEFFAAKYLQLQARSLSCFNSVFKKDTSRKWDGVLVYLCGLLRGQDRVLLSLYRNVLQRDFSGICGVFRGAGERIHNRYHLPLECLHESGLFCGFCQVHQHIVPSFFHFSTMTCSNCLEGFVLATQTTKVNHQLVLDGTDLASNPLFQHRVLDALARCVNLSTLVLGNCISITSTLEYISKVSMMHLRSLRHLYIYLSDLMHPEVSAVDTVDMDCMTPLHTEGLETLVLEGSACRNYKGAGQIAMGHGILLLLVSSFLGPATKHLVLKECDVDTDTGYALLHKLESCTSLRMVHLESLDILQDIFSSIVVLLRHNMDTRYLAVNSCTFRGDHEHLLRGMPSLWSKLLKGSNLRRLSIRSLIQPLLDRTVASLHRSLHLSHLELTQVRFDSGQWDKLCKSFQSLQHVEQLSLVDTGIDASTLTKLSTTVPMMPALRSLDLSRNFLGRHPPFPQLCIAITASNTLNEVKLERCSISDANMVHLGLMLNSTHLQKLSLLENKLGLTEESVDSIIQLFKGKKSFKELYIPLAMFNRQQAKKLAKNLVGSLAIETLCVASSPDKSFLKPKEFYKLYRTVHKTLKSLKSFALGIDQDVVKIHAPDHSGHVSWCDLICKL